MNGPLISIVSEPPRLKPTKSNRQWRSHHPISATLAHGRKHHKLPQTNLNCHEMSTSSEIYPVFDLITFLHLGPVAHPRPPAALQPCVFRVIACASARAASSQRHASTWPCRAERCSAVLRSSPVVESSNAAALPVAKVVEVTWKPPPYSSKHLLTLYLELIFGALNTFSEKIWSTGGQETVRKNRVSHGTMKRIDEAANILKMCNCGNYH